MFLKDKVAIITGAGRGIGRATALRFAEEGASVVVTDIEYDVAQAVVNEINGRAAEVTGQGTAANGGSQAVSEPVMVKTGLAMAVQVDVTQQDSVRAMVKAAVAQFGRIDILINNAGIVRDAQLANMSEKDFDMVIDVNLKGVFNCTQAVAPVMVNQGSGVIISTASMVVSNGNFGQTNYVASKAGVVGMTKTWAKELGAKGIRVNAVAPGLIQTRLTAAIPGKVMDKLQDRIPLGYLGEPEDIANAFTWLASDEAKYVTGHVLAVDGGAVF